MYYVYILYSENIDKYYIGSTENYDKRLLDHNSSLSTYTKRGVPWKIVYIETLTDRSSALIREKQIKNKKSRKYIEYLIKIRPIAHSVIPKVFRDDSSSS
jgi:putative endonuclease